MNKKERTAKELLKVARDLLAADDVTKEDYNEALQDYVDDSIDFNGVEMNLKEIHAGDVMDLGKGLYVQCADFDGEDGKVYDLDIVFKADEDGLTHYRSVLHKIDGEEEENHKKEMDLLK